MANSNAKPVLQQIPPCDRASSVGKIDIGSQPLPDFFSLGLVWDPQSDTLRISSRKFVDATARREMTGQLSSQFDPLEVVSPLLLGGKLILQKVATSGVGWDENVSEDIKKEWKKWLSTSNKLEGYAVTRNNLVERIEPMSDVTYQFHGFCDASDSAFSCVVYLRGVHDGRSHVNFVIGKPKVVLTHQKGLVIARKELEAAELLSRLMHIALRRQYKI